MQMHQTVDRAPGRPQGFWSGHARVHQDTERAQDPGHEHVTMDNVGEEGLIAAVGCLNYYIFRTHS